MQKAIRCKRNFLLVKHIRKEFNLLAKPLANPKRENRLALLSLRRFPAGSLSRLVRGNRLAKQRDHLFTFLDYYGADATNNLAERQLRPAVIARKISCGNKTKKGAHTWQILASIAATCAQRSTSFIAELARAAPFKPR